MKVQRSALRLPWTTRGSRSPSLTMDGNVTGGGIEAPRPIANLSLVFELGHGQVLGRSGLIAV